MKTASFRTLSASVLLSLLLGTSLYAQRQHAEIARYLNENRSNLELTDADIQDWEIYSQHTDEKFGITYKYLRQKHDNVPVYNAVATFAEMNSQVILSGNSLQKNIAARANASRPVLSSEEALRHAIRQLGLVEPQYLTVLSCEDKQHCLYEGGTISEVDIPMELLYFPGADGTIRLVWDLSINMKASSDWWSIRVDATTGELLDKLNWTLHCDFGGDHSKHGHAPTRNHPSAVSSFVAAPAPPPGTDQYNVFAIPVESPNHGPRTLLVGPYNAVASPYGWHDTNGSAGAEFTTTQGNNVLASEDQNGNDGIGALANGGATLNFNFPLNLNQAPVNYQNAAITNLFYMNNIMHDVWYHYGFNEASGNFQENNYGNGGAASDMVNADAQDGSGTNNANFSTPNDGSNPRMQMYLWSPGVQNLLTVNTPAGIAGTYSAVEADFGGPVPAVPITSNLVLFNDNSGTDPNDACQAAVNAAAMNGNIVVIRRGDCEFGFKVLAAQNAGATAVIMINNVAGSPIAMGAGANGASVTIPSVMISNTDGALIMAQMALGAVNATLVNPGGSFDIDGDFDNGVVAHEYGHGISNRLTGGPANSNCLSNAEQMGEGWSDWFGLMLTIEPGDTETDIRGIGTFASGESPSGYGIRPAPYTTDLAVNNYTYSATNNTATISQPHGIGFVWCTMLWDMTWALIDRYGYDPNLYTGTGGNNVAMDLVMQALKLQPCSPGFVDGRNAILQADQLLYGGANQCLIWKAFAARGLGFSATQGSTNNRSDQTQAFNLPAGMATVSGSQSVTSCGNYTWSATGQTYSNSGSYVTTLYSQNGCDSVATLNLTIVAPTAGSQAVSACSNYTWPATGTTYTASGTYSTLLTGSNGCDSTATLNLTINNPYVTTDNISACVAYYWPATGLVYPNAGTYVANLTAANGCDSTVTLNLTISTVASSSQNVSTCSSYFWAANGNTYPSSGTYSVQLVSATGCDSIVTLNLTVNSPTSGSVSASSCESYTWPSNGQTYTSSGAYTTNLTNAAGCDSLVTLNLTILNSSSPTTQTESACGSYVWPASGQIYSSSGMYTTTLTNAAGCDSTVFLDLTILNGTTGSENVTACGSYFWTASGLTYNSAGTYTATLTNSEGCDSTATLVLTMNSVNVSINYLDVITLTSNQAGATYQWLDCANSYAAVPGATSQTFTATANGSYACQITLNGCVDTTACRTIDKVGIEENDFGAGFMVHPNPTFGDLHVDLDEVYEWINVKVFASNGQLVAEKRYTQVAGFDFQIDAAPGYYIMEIATSSDKGARVKIMKE